MGGFEVCFSIPLAKEVDILLAQEEEPAKSWTHESQYEGSI